MVKDMERVETKRLVSMKSSINIFFTLTQGLFFIAFKEGKRDREADRHTDRQTLIGCLSQAP